MTSGDRAEANLLRAAELWCEAAGGDRWESEGIVCTSGPVPMRSFNQAIVTAPLSDPRPLRDAVSRFGHDRFRVRLRGAIASESQAAIASAGLKRQGGIPNLILEEPPLTDARADDLRLGRVCDERTLADHVVVVAEAFGWDPDDLARVFTTKLLSQADWRGWVGYVGGEPVATAQLVVHSAVAGIYYVATREHYQHRGFGWALTSTAVSEGFARGCDLAALQASPAGYPLYRRMGFRDAGEYLTYVPASEHS